MTTILAKDYVVTEEMLKEARRIDGLEEDCRAHLIDLELIRKIYLAMRALEPK